MRANGLLGSAKLVDIDPGDRSAAKNNDDGYQGLSLYWLLLLLLSLFGWKIR